MNYRGYVPEQVLAQVRSYRGEIFDLALPETCTVHELQNFLLDEYGYGPGTVLLYNGAVPDPNSYVSSYPFGSLMILNPAEVNNASGFGLPTSAETAPPPPPPQDRQQQQQQQHQAQRHQQPYAEAPKAAIRKTRPLDSSAVSNESPASFHSTAPASTKSTKGKGATPLAAGGAGPPPAKMPSAKTATYPNRTSSADSCTSQTSGKSWARPSAKAKVKENRRLMTATAPPTGPANATTSVSESAPEAATNEASVKPSWASTAPAPKSTEGGRSSTASEVAPRSPSAPRSTAGTPSAGGTDSDENHRRRMIFTVHCHIPALNRVVKVSMNGESSVVDLLLAVVAAAPEVAGVAHVVSHGKTLPQTAHSKLFDLGIRSDAHVFIASGEYSNPEIIVLLEVEEDTARVEQALQEQLTSLQRKGYYEELMRILFRTDSLQSLEGEWRQRRKDAVKRITSLQDTLNVEGSSH